MRDIVESDGAPRPVGPYSQAVWAGDTLFLSGQIGVGEGGALPSSFAEQARRAMENVVAVLKAAGLTPANVVKTTVYLTDMGRFAEVNAVYGEFFERPYPARAAVEVAALPLGALVEVECVARR